MDGKVLTVVALFGWINSILDLSQTGVILGFGWTHSFLDWIQTGVVCGKV